MKLLAAIRELGGTLITAESNANPTESHLEDTAERRHILAEPHRQTPSPSLDQKKGRAIRTLLAMVTYRYVAVVGKAKAAIVRKGPSSSAGMIQITGRRGITGTRTLDVVRYLGNFAAFALLLLTGSVAVARPFGQHSGSECYLHGHRMYVPVGLNYPRQAWSSWGISCPTSKPEGERTETTTGGSSERPAEWCGWWMRQHLGSRLGPEYNAARNWLNVGRPLPGPLPGAIGVQEHHVFQVVRVVGPDQILAISGNDHNAVRTRIRSTAGVIGWRDVSDMIGVNSSDASKQKDEGAADDGHAVNALDGLAW